MPILDRGDPTGPMLKGMTYMVLPKRPRDLVIIYTDFFSFLFTCHGIGKAFSSEKKIHAFDGHPISEFRKSAVFRLGNGIVDVFRTDKRLAFDASNVAYVRIDEPAKKKQRATFSFTKSSPPPL